jgi:3-phosphoshikimate 1-carboxyvinyltransferase
VFFGEYQVNCENDMLEKILEIKNNANGQITLPGSKSLSNRVLLLAALAEGETRIDNLLDSDDVHFMLQALKELGVIWKKTEDGSLLVMGKGRFSSHSVKKLFLGNAGTAMRPLAAVLCAMEGEFVLEGEPRMYERPIGDLFEAMKQLGADFDYIENQGFPPLRIRGKALEGRSVEIRGNISSQFLTALLMSAPLLKNELTIHVIGDLVSKPYIDITIEVMKRFGVNVVNDSYKTLVVPSNQSYRSPGNYFIEGDASSASYFLAAGAIAGGRVEVKGVGSESIQGDKDFAKVLEKMGAKVNYFPNSICIEKGDLVGIDIDLNAIPDAAMTIATTALFARGRTTIRNIYNWRVKETDRLAAMATELRKVGAIVEEGDDYISIDPPDHLQYARIETYNDHRMAMCFALVSFGQRVCILDPKCTSKTFPLFFDEFEKITSC